MLDTKCRGMCWVLRTILGPNSPTRIKALGVLEAIDLLYALFSYYLNLLIILVSLIMAPPGALSALEATLGALEISIFFILVSFGFATMQTYHYHHNSSKDRVLVRTSVYIIWVSNMFVMVGLCYWVYSATVTPNWKIQGIYEAPMLTTFSVFFGMFADRVVQIVLAYRIFLFQRRVLLAVFSSALCLSSCATGLGMSIQVFRMRHDLVAFQRKNDSLLTTALLVQAVTEIFLTSVTCWLLSKARQEGSAK
jgi:hypothetical protein